MEFLFLFYAFLAVSIPISPSNPRTHARSLAHHLFITGPNGSESREIMTAVVAMAMAMARGGQDMAWFAGSGVGYTDVLYCTLLYFRTCKERDIGIDRRRMAGDK